ncbi:hypothetical protein B566_EDAN019000 [Ephemera danica]|nr:hypothetical protein B566_EDAN019000 [Ephemera danica]
MYLMAMNKEHGSMIDQLPSGIHRSSRSKTFSCQFCSKEFNYKSHLMRHISNLHGGKESHPVQCEICYKHYKNTDSLRHHMFATHNQRLR